MVTIKFKVSHQILTNDFNQVLSVSLLITASTAPAKGGLLEMTQRPLLEQDFALVSLSFAETTKDPVCSQVKRQNLV